MDSNSELTDDRYIALASFRHTLRQFQAFSDEQATACGLTPQQHQALLAIRGAGSTPVNVGYIAERLILKPHSATGLIDRLVALELVQRGTSPEDRRQVLLALTPEALELLSRLSLVHREEIVRLRPMLTELLEQLDVS